MTVSELCGLFSIAFLDSSEGGGRVFIPRPPAFVFDHGVTPHLRHRITRYNGVAGCIDSTCSRTHSPSAGGRHLKPIYTHTLRGGPLMILCTRHIHPPYHRLSPVAFTRLSTPNQYPHPSHRIHHPESRSPLPPPSHDSDREAPAAVMVAVVVAESRAGEGSGAGEGGWAEAGFTHHPLHHMRKVTLAFGLLPYTNRSAIHEGKIVSPVAVSPHRR